MTKGELRKARKAAHMTNQPTYLPVRFFGERRMREVRATYQGTAVFSELGRVPVALVLDERCYDPRDVCEHLVCLHPRFGWVSAKSHDPEDFAPELDLNRLAEAM